MMKWSGWGDEKKSFPMEQKPTLWPWIRSKLGIIVEEKTLPVDRASVKLASPCLNKAFVKDIKKILDPKHILTDDNERLLHTYGKSYPDLIRVRRGEIRRAPDMVLLPESHNDVEKIVASAQENNVSVIPFGGGTNIVGCTEPLAAKDQMTVSLDLRLLSKLISIDKKSNTAVFQPGAKGPDLEEQLAKHGYSLGHYPDSFEYSTLGGWLATRSAGMQSDAYGKIEDMVVAMKLVTPSGTITTKTTPASSAGPDLNRLIVGSEGTLGVITEATMRVHKSPEVRDYRGFLFKTFEEGTAAIEECLDRGFAPSMVRLQDSGETELALNMKAPKKGLEGFIQKPIKAYLKRAGYSAPCIMIIGFEGTDESLQTVRKNALAIIKKYKGFSLGKGVGKTWSQDKFNVPYLRDYIMDYGCMCDVAETAATWSKLLPLYKATIKAVKAQFQKETGFGYIGCHISHTYQTGACLYFTYGAKQIKGQELDQYYNYKRLITETFMQNGGTLSHHHAIGYEHMPWMEQEVSRTGLMALQGIKTTLDPKNIFNPGKLIPMAAALHPVTAERTDLIMKTWVKNPKPSSDLSL
jgi:alkyldihydroxyacetonephosphate synthase